MMHGVSYIQRGNTKGGIAPKAVCFGQNVGQSLVVSYSTDYIFWRAN